jgi:hypothetical protein
MVVPGDGLLGLATIDARASFGIMPNAKHQTAHGFMKGAPYELAIVEFDDQGLCYDRGQMDGVASRLDAMRSDETDAIVLVFVHGWKHDARTDDENLSSFRLILSRTAKHEVLSRTAEHEAKPIGGLPRPVLGIFVGWRGLTGFGPLDAVADITFWGRQAAAQRVATGSIRELFGRLRHYRNHRLNEHGNPLLVIAGHSFGGMIVFSALAQSLIQAASAPTGHVLPGFADLVLLVNPAIEAARYLPIHDLVSSQAFRGRATSQLPIFICAQADNDQAVGTAFPLGNVMRRFTQATRGDLEKECTTRALGFVKSFQTHTLSGPPGGGDPFVLHPSAIRQTDPFWVVRAAKEVIDGHGGIWQNSFMMFIAGIVFQHVDVSRTFPNRTPPGELATRQYPAPASTPPVGPSGDLAAFARTIAPFR